MSIELKKSPSGTPVTQPMLLLERKRFERRGRTLQLLKVSQTNKNIYIYIYICIYRCFRSHFGSSICLAAHDASWHLHEVQVYRIE